MEDLYMPVLPTRRNHFDASAQAAANLTSTRRMIYECILTPLRLRLSFNLSGRLSDVKETPVINQFHAHFSFALVAGKYLDFLMPKFVCVLRSVLSKH